MPLADGTSYPTGFFAGEALTPYERFMAAGVDVVVATPDGRPPVADPYGLEEIFHHPDEDKDFLASVVRTFAHVSPAGVDLAGPQGRRTGPPSPSGEDVDAAIEAVLAESRRQCESIAQRMSEINGFQHPANLAEMSDEQMGEFDAVFAPGGHGPMVDLADNPDVTRLLGTLHRSGATIAALDHGPAMLLSAPANTDGQWLFDGFRVTALTDEEEIQTPAGRLGMQWYLESALRNAGSVFDDGRAAWNSHVVVDRNLITGQNPNSTNAVTDAVLKSLDVL